jgi:RNA polymerase sigma factor (TIGR02999 family)
MTGEPITALLRKVSEGNQGAREALLALVYGELHRLAESAFRSERPDHTLQPTALVHEAFLKLFEGQAPPVFADRAHFLGVAARVMRQILVNHARAWGAQKRGGQFTVSLNERSLEPPGPAGFIELNEALETLGREDAELVALVEMRYIAGMTAEEVAELRGHSVSTVRRDVRYALARLHTLIAPSK